MIILLGLLLCAELLLDLVFEVLLELLHGRLDDHFLLLSAQLVGLDALRHRGQLHGKQLLLLLGLGVVLVCRTLLLRERVAPLHELLLLGSESLGLLLHATQACQRHPVLAWLHEVPVVQLELVDLVMQLRVCGQQLLVSLVLLLSRLLVGVGQVLLEEAVAGRLGHRLSLDLLVGNQMVADLGKVGLEDAQLLHEELLHRVQLCLSLLQSLLQLAVLLEQGRLEAADPLY